MANDNKNYHKTRFRFDPGRLKVWKAITEYLQPYVGDDKTVFDMGSGYGDFINQIKAKRKIALDISSDVKDHIGKDVEFTAKPSTDLSWLKADSVDVVFSSNLLEHLDKAQLDTTMLGVKKAMKKGGTLILVGPNFRFSYKQYFDDYTHVTIFTHLSLRDQMYEYGFRPVRIEPKFLPLTLKSRLPKSYILTKLYLMSPFRPLGKQMLLVFRLED